MQDIYNTYNIFIKNSHECLNTFVRHCILFSFILFTVQVSVIIIPARIFSTRFPSLNRNCYFYCIFNYTPALRFFPIVLTFATVSWFSNTILFFALLSITDRPILYELLVYLKLIEHLLDRFGSRTRNHDTSVRACISQRRNAISARTERLLAENWGMRTHGSEVLGRT